MPKIKEVIGIVVMECQNCKGLFVVNTTAIPDGFQYHCDCGRVHGAPPYSTLQVEINRIDLPGMDDCDTPTYKKACKELHKEYDKKLNVKGREALSLDEYKTLLVDLMLGKKPKVPTKSKTVVSFEESGIDVVSIVNTLRSLGFSEADAKAKINVAVKDGFKFEEEILRYIMTLS